MRRAHHPAPSMAPAPVPLDASRFTSANRRRLSGPAMRTFIAIADLWALSQDDRLLVLGLPSRSTYYGWVKAARDGEDITLPTDTLLRISAVLGIHKALRILFASDADGLRWLREPHAALPFGGQPPIALALGGTQDGLMLLRRFLDAARGGLYMAPNAADDGAAALSDEDILIT
ncbi:DUF2384 domain-containing protein [Roseomonas sp. JC162]|uniref:DUF2384 domain-containing protein n=1 Tax=Neoroseomonas marina TaxID=1232220 RepID=A0A848ECM7_9PROT|nr:MbcA/ParS/Xre antitoxin family protein [Neoroseomonas marina]NMJ41065.1 DUF2384 domain-containing protein [Neoroseomonas marina]